MAVHGQFALLRLIQLRSCTLVNIMYLVTYPKQSSVSADTGIEKPWMSSLTLHQGRTRDWFKRGQTRECGGGGANFEISDALSNNLACIIQ